MRQEIHRSLPRAGTKKRAWYRRGMITLLSRCSWSAMVRLCILEDRKRRQQSVGKSGCRHHLGCFHVGRSAKSWASRTA